ncbi:MAG: RNA polymerase sigma-70 factor [Chloroflexi bacterium]|nr:RNA polymerase sigma-70 factor [Chloroflexota bacterium]MBI3170917.1 RNA polymerase sigma-70 factor [Chloroflexota bacterium]
MDQSEIFTQYHSLLFSIAYRMLGSAMEAEDMVQEAFLRWHNAADAVIESPKAYLTTVITRLCIDHLRLARVKREEYIGPWLPEPLFVDPAQDIGKGIEAHESLSLAFLLLMESLTPMERAVFLLHEVFAYSHTEIAAMVEQSEANCRQILHRAKHSLERNKRHIQVSPEDQKRLFSQFLQASANGDVQGLLSMLADDITLYSDGGFARRPIYGSKNVANFIFGLLRKASPGLELVVSEVNAQPALLCYVDGNLFGVLTLHVSASKVKDVYFQLNPQKLTTIPPRS